MCAASFAGKIRTDSPTKWVSAKFGVLCAAVTIVALFLVIRRVHFHALVDTIRAMRVGWFLVATALYGSIFLAGAWRWHLALRLNHSSAEFPSTMRFTIIGHFAYLILFGAAAGDAAKAMLYARKNELPMSKILVSASLDRLMGSGGLFLFAAMAFVLADTNGGFAQMHSVQFHWHTWLLIAAAITLVIVLIARRSRRHSAMKQFGLTFLDTGKRLVSSPKTLLSGLVCGILMQAALNGVLAMNLQAVCHGPIPWLRLAWTFPVISVISGLPITIAGIGSRDGAALALLGAFGIAGPDAVAMSMLTLCVSVFWALVGGVVLWVEMGMTANLFAEPPATAEMEN